MTLRRPKATPTRMAWWRYPEGTDRTEYMHGVQQVGICPEKMQPVAPIILLGGRTEAYYTVGEFLGWCDNIENREEGRTVISAPADWRKK